MAVFSSPRVLVIDDEPKEAMPIILAFAKLSIPTAWYTGVGSDVPSAPLPNVRVLVLDLVLGTSGFEPKNTAGVVLRALAPTLKAGPCLFLLWTAHPDEKEAFEQALNSYNEGLEEDQRVLPLATICISKSDFIREGHADAQALMTEIEQTLSRLAPFDLLLKWEASCAEAAAIAAGHLSRLAFSWGGGVAAWGDKLGVILDKLVKASAGGAAPTERTSPDYLSALFEPLSLIHEDRTRQFTSTTAESVWPEMPTGALDAEMVNALLNHILLAGQAEARDLPGTVLPLREVQITGAPFVASTNDLAFEQFLCRTFEVDRYQRDKDTILASLTVVIVELTPACDHAQSKRERLRFATGLLWPLEHKKWIKQKASYLFPIGPFVHKQKAVTLVLDSLHFFSLPKDAELPEPLFRLRSHVRADLQAWLGGHLARPGHLSM